MATKAQTEANRMNAAKSTGPRTDEGKIRSGQNALRHGLCAGIPKMDGDNDIEHDDALEALRDEYLPYGPTEEILVYKLAEHFAYSKRVSYLLSEQLEYNDKGDGNLREIGLLMRYQATCDRGFLRCLTELRKLQKERKLEEIGFVSQEAAEAATAVEPETTQPPQTAPATPVFTMAATQITREAPKIAA